MGFFVASDLVRFQAIRWFCATIFLDIGEVEHILLTFKEIVFPRPSEPLYDCGDDLRTSASTQGVAISGIESCYIPFLVPSLHMPSVWCREPSRWHRILCRYHVSLPADLSSARIRLMVQQMGDHP